MNAQLQLMLCKPPRARKGPLYFETTPLTADQFRAALTRTQAQDERVLAVFRLTQSSMSPSAVHRALALNGYDCPITSVRRAIHTLTRDGYLVKLWESETGPWSMPEHKWALPTGKVRA